MTRNNLIFTHGAVFSVGIAAAMIANSFRDSPTNGGTTSDVSSPSARSSASAARLQGEGTTTGSRTKDDPRQTGKKGSGTPKERLAGIVRITDSFERERALLDLIDNLGPDEFAGVAEQFRELDHLGD